MIRWLRSVAIALVIAALAPMRSAWADTVEDHLAHSRELYDQRDFVHARDELLAAYQLEPRPEILFALGQVELNIGELARAIDYYERFIATNPGEDQAALAQQAIGAARARLAERPATATPPPPPPHRAWDIEDTGLAALGGATAIVGAGLLIYGLHAAGDHSGTLAEYNNRLSQATTTQWAGAGCLVAGGLVVGAAILRWRIHLVDSEIQPIAAPKAAGVTWVGRW